MFNNSIFEQFLALQNKSAELTEKLRAISIDTGKELVNIHQDAVRDLGSMGQDYFKKFSSERGLSNPFLALGGQGYDETLKFWGAYQDKLKKTINAGSHEFINEIEGLASHARSDLENVVNGFTNNGPVAGTPIMAAIKSGLDMYMQSFDQIAAATKTTIGNMEKLSDVKM